VRAPRQVAALLEGLLHDMRKAARADPRGYSQLRTEAASLLGQLPDAGQAERYAALYQDGVLSALQALQQAEAAHGHRGGSRGGTSRSASRRGSSAHGGDHAHGQSGGWLSSGGWLLQAAGFGRRSSSAGGGSGGGHGHGHGPGHGHALPGSGGASGAASARGHHKAAVGGLLRPQTSCGSLGTADAAASRATAATLGRRPSAQLP
jgi:hypothetical protein